MKKITFKQIIYIILIILLLIFTFQNLRNVLVNLLVFKFELPLVILIVIVFFIGYFTAKVLQNMKKENKEPSED